MDEDFRKFVAAAKTIMANSGQCTNEESSKQFLILPFLGALGYNVFDPSEVSPEYPADFDKKHQERVDYVIIRDGVPVIAIECKAVGVDLQTAWGQTASYFNALQSVKMAIVTNGIEYRFYADTDAPNVMDKSAFLSFSVQDIAEGKAENQVKKGILEQQKDRFNPSNIGNEARKKRILNAFTALLLKYEETPTEALVKTFLDDIEFRGQKTKKLIAECEPLAKQAIAAFIDGKLLAIVSNRTLQTQTAVLAPAAETPPPVPDSGIVTTEDELSVYAYAKQRLAFLVKDEAHYALIDKIKWKDYQTTFKVFLEKEISGGLFNYRISQDGIRDFTFNPLDEERKYLKTKNISDIDDQLLESFLARIAEKTKKA
ncbi:endonuclease [Alphaproteobacteria bacterium]|nr:endonuclease [Alphaproteobacteria bacterium]